MSNHHKVICGCEICISESMIQCELSAWRPRHKSKLRSDFEKLHSIRSVQERNKI